MPPCLEELIHPGNWNWIHSASKLAGDSVNGCCIPRIGINYLPPMHPTWWTSSSLALLMLGDKTKTYCTELWQAGDRRWEWSIDEEFYRLPCVYIYIWSICKASRWVNQQSASSSSIPCQRIYEWTELCNCVLAARGIPCQLKAQKVHAEKWSEPCLASS
jgi:hypothetical protein